MKPRLQHRSVVRSVVYFESLSRKGQIPQRRLDRMVSTVGSRHRCLHDKIEIRNRSSGGYRRGVRAIIEAKRLNIDQDGFSVRFQILLIRLCPNRACRATLCEQAIPTLQRQTATVSAPSITRLVPEILLASGLQRNTTPLATSSAVPNLPVGLTLIVDS